MKYWNFEKYKKLIRENGRPHYNEVIGSLGIYAFYPLAYRTGSLDIIGAMTIIVVGFLLAFKSQRDLYLHSKRIYLPLGALTVFASGLYYASFNTHGKEFLFTQPSRLPASDIAGLSCSVVTMILLIYSVYSSKCEISE